MKLERHILTILLIALLFLLIGSVSAADTNDTQTVSASDNDILSVENDVDVLSEGEYNYTKLKDQFRFDGDITLIAGNYTYVSGDGDTIEITTSRVIDGNGAVIDMANSGHRAFSVTTDGVTIKNLTIKNANFNGNGGAIYFSSSGTVENCNFTNNTAKSNGGAVYFLNKGNVTNCNFTDNSAEHGGAINMGSGSVENCNFTDNTATSGSGGAIYMSSGSVENCNFTDNTATSGSGGAVYFGWDGTVTNCNFTANQASNLCGAVYFSSNGNVTNCNFTANQASDEGGAIRMSSGSVTNCNFTDNKATGSNSRGGAVYFSRSGTVENCNFTDNKATGSNSRGGAVYFLYNGDVTNCNFANNSATQGGSILSVRWLGVTADTCIFKTSSDEPFNTRNLPPTLTVENFTTFYGSSEKLTFDLKTNSSIPVTNGNISISVYFKDNDSWVGNYSCLSGEGWIPDLPVGSYYAIFDTEYAEFKPINRTITILAPEYTFWALNYTINANDNSVINLSNDYYFDSEYDSEFVNGVVINRPLTINGNGHTIDALQKARIFNVNSDNVVLNNITFTNATSGSGGAVYFSSSGSVINCNFTNNIASYSGGAIYFAYSDNPSTVTNCNFTGNNATHGGGAVYFMNTGEVTNCNFTDNEAKYSGAVYFSRGGTVENCNFTNNSASDWGGAILFVNTGTVTNCNFTGNNATTGSAIYFYRESSTKTISNSRFLNNRANAEILEVTKNDDNITITFKGNDNLLNAIYSNGDVSFTNVTYWSTNGIANTDSSTPVRSNKEAGQNITVEIYDSNGQSVDNVTLVTDENGQVTYSLLNNENCLCKAYHIEDCYYTYAEYKDLGDFNRLQKYINEAEEYSTLTLYRNYTFTPGFDDNLTNGIVIDKALTINGNGYTIDALQKARIFNVNSDNVVLNNITFTNATASGSGGAVYFSSSGSVTNCNFTDNKATGDYSQGGAIRMGFGTVTNCNFTGNKATGDGGAICMTSGRVTN